MTPDLASMHWGTASVLLYSRFRFAGLGLCCYKAITGAFFVGQP